MKFFGIFFLVITAVCGYFWATDGPGSGMWIPTVIFAVLGALGFVLDARRTKSLNDKAGK